MEFMPCVDGVLQRADRLVVAQRIDDAEQREAVDDQPALIAQDHLLARQFLRQQSFVERDHRLHEGDLGVQAGLLDHPHRPGRTG